MKKKVVIPTALLIAAVVGGGSTYTPELIEGFARRADQPAAGGGHVSPPR